MTPIRSKFCTVETVAALRGIAIERVYDAVDCGEYLWVWDVCAGDRQDRSAARYLRFWSDEINGLPVRNFKLVEVIAKLLPLRRAIPGQFQGLRQWEMINLIMINRGTLKLLEPELGAQKIDGGIFYPRQKIEAFFLTRWCGQTASRPEQGALNLK